MGVLQPWDVADLLLDGLGLGTQRRKLRPVDPHHNGLASTGQHLLDALPEIGLYVAIKSWVGLDGAVHLFQGLVVIDIGADTDPVLTEVHAVDLVSQIRLPDMGTAVAHALDLSEILAGRDRARSLSG